MRAIVGIRNLVDGVDDELLSGLIDRRIDLAVTSQSFKHREVVPIGTCSYSDTFAVFCSSSHPLRGNVTLSEAMAYGWVMPGTAFTPRSKFEEIIAKHTPQLPRVSAQCTSVEMMIAVSANSDLLCWLPTPLLEPYLANGIMRRLSVSELVLDRRFMLYRRQSGILPDAAQQFVRHFPLLQGAAT